MRAKDWILKFIRDFIYSLQQLMKFYQKLYREKTQPNGNSSSSSSRHTCEWPNEQFCPSHSQCHYKLVSIEIIHKIRYTLKAVYVMCMYALFKYIQIASRRTSKHRLFTFILKCHLHCMQTFKHTPPHTATDLTFEKRTVHPSSEWASKSGWDGDEVSILTIRVQHLVCVQHK